MMGRTKKNLEEFENKILFRKTNPVKIISFEMGGR